MAVLVARAQGDPRALLQRKGHLVAAALRPAGEDAVSLRWELRLRSSTGLDVHALLRVPRETRPPYAGTVLLGGLKRGRRIVLADGLDAIARRAVLVSPDYPLPSRRHASPAMRLVGRAVSLRSAAFDTVAEVLLLLDYLESRPDIERQRLFLVGGSLGAEVVTVAGGIDPRPAAVVALYGGAPVSRLVAATLEPDVRSGRYPRWIAGLAGHALAWLLVPLEPARYVGGIAPRPLLMINGTDDRLVPRDSVMTLYDAARPPKELQWHAGEHIRPSEAELLGELSDRVADWLVTRGLVARRAAPPARPVP